MMYRNGRRRLRTIGLFVGLLSLSGCGSWWHGGYQSVTIFTSPLDAQVIIDERVHLLAPGTVSLSRKDDHQAVITKEGYEPKTMALTRTWSWWVIGDIFGCAIIFSPACISTDKDNGGYYTFKDKVYVTLEQKSAGLVPSQ
ncbi:MAG: hypothetical protein Nkreftii_002944 [Candidatus Nitrospira kreftii]|uniref:PEGA domain-containing protein n=1 Tax=Candidatus Nitrospira kreftii TaxID=2652173 RepID=A0A7S8FG18_9BACT|nr:MAG: hypothetical protein Nkreftii_002944 [Candidatus Nitrospira kreftii]